MTPPGQVPPFGHPASLPAGNVPPPGYVPPGYVPPQQPYGPARPNWPYASWGDRAIGFLIDQFLVGIAMVVLYVGLGGLLAGITRVGSSDASAGICCLMIALFPVATLGVGFYNRVYLVSTRGASIGQGFMKLRVITASGQNLTMGTAFLRLLAQVVLSIIPIVSLINLLWPLWDEQKQTLHDKAVSCFVIKAGI